jgi:hypothetical protein
VIHGEDGSIIEESGESFIEEGVGRVEGVVVEIVTGTERYWIGGS